MVLHRLLRRAAPAAKYAVPDGRRVYAIGDIHGRRDLLDALLAQIDADDAARGTARTTIILLGDLIDRGPDPAGVIERLTRLAADGRDMRFLMGNHEEVFLKAVEGDPQAIRYLPRIDARSTVASYGVDTAIFDAMDVEALAQALAARIPPHHIAFLRGCEDQVRIGDYLFVHAGIRPRVALDAQSGSDLRWIRGEFLDYRGDHGCIVVHGHTITDDVDERPNRIGIDTGAFATGRLTALALEGRDRWFLST